MPGLPPESPISTQKNNPRIIPPQKMEGKEIRAKKTWEDLAASEMQLWMMRELEKQVGLNDVEAFNLGIINKQRSEAMKGKGEEIRREFLKSTIQIKFRDE